RNEDLVVAYETEGAALHTEHADDAEVQDPRALGCAALPSTTEGLPQLDRLADRVNVAEEVGRGRRTENGDLRVHVQVRGREEVSAVEAPVANDGVVLGHTGHARVGVLTGGCDLPAAGLLLGLGGGDRSTELVLDRRSEEHTSELQSRVDIVCRLLLG